MFSICRRFLSEYTRNHLPVPPEIASNVFIAPTATVLGNTKLKSQSSVWYNAVLRADLNLIEVDEGSNIQDGVAVHVTRKLPVRIGKRVSVGHNATLHGCTIGDDTLIGMNAVVLDGCTIGKNSIVGAHALCGQHKSFPDGHLILGSPAKAIRPLTEAELELVRDNARRYIQYAKDHVEHFSDKK